MPPPFGAWPFWMVKPARTLLAPSDVWNQTTGPVPPPSRNVTPGPPVDLIVIGLPLKSILPTYFPGWTQIVAPSLALLIADSRSFIVFTGLLPLGHAGS